ncbi:uncharacterized protein LOC123511534 isoform X3 [Portunus trituberculatus]|uniref:uncharacterized protein LOC123511534 isoform X3 n=1 Tax=Portunus trituberculatus TaxID=210409 RepID=UPI001E1CBA9A|nr:uncharacterized protein LOC123511534 isoform X3 [Portunus trituberculatus]
MGIKFSCGDSARDVTALDIRGRQQQQHCSSVRRHDLSLGGEEAATGETPSGGGVFSPLVCDVISVHQCRHVGVCTTPGSSCRLAWDTDAQCLLVLHTGTDTPARGTVRLCARTAASSRSIMGATSAIVLVFVGCCTNVVFLELLVKEEPGSGNIITCAQFVFIALYGFLFTTQLGTKKNVVPIRDYMVLVVLFFVVNVCNNLAFAFKISMPLHMIFRSGGLIANMVMAVVVLGRRYSPSKCLSVGMITLGTLVCTYASAQTLYEGGGGGSSDGGSGEDSGVVVPSLMTWLGGIALLTFALFLSARMGIFQECLYARYGKHPWEALFYIVSEAPPLHLIVTSGCVFVLPSVVRARTLPSWLPADSGQHSRPCPEVHLLHPPALSGLCTSVVSHSSHVALSPGQHPHTVCVHQLCVPAHLRVHLPHRHAGAHSTQVSFSSLLHRILLQPLHCHSLAGHSTCVWRHSGLL